MVTCADGVKIRDKMLTAYDGAASFVLDKAGWSSVRRIDMATATALVNDASPQLGADLDANGFDIQFDDGDGIEDDSGNEQLIFNKTATAVNYVEITNAATGNAPAVTAAGSDANIDLNLNGQGTGIVNVVEKLQIGNSGVAADYEAFRVVHTANSGAGFLVQRSGNNPFVGFTGWDTGAERVLYFGGGGWGFDDANRITFYTDATYAGGADQGVRRFNIFSSGDVTIGTGTPPTANSGKVLAFGDNAADPTMGGNTAGVYGKDVAGTVELFGVDEAGNVTQLTSHNFTLFTPSPTDEYPFSFSAKNHFIGQEIGVDMFRALRALEVLSGETLIHLRDLPPEETLDWSVVEEEKRLASIKEIDSVRPGETPPPLYIKKPVPTWIQTILDQKK